MLTLILKGSLQKIRKDIDDSAYLAEALEVRLDLCENISPLDLQEVLRKTRAKVILTLRMKHQGGGFEKDFKSRLKHLLLFSFINPSFIDLEHDTPIEDIRTVKSFFPSTQIILSYHDFEKSPLSLEGVFEGIKAKKIADIIKIAVYVKNSVEAMKVFSFARKKFLENEPLIMIPMGSYGQFVRILTKIHSRYFCYCSSDAETASLGQLCIKELFSTYFYTQKSKEATVYALLGNPVSKSPSHVTHNYLLKSLNKNCFYVKIELSKNELREFFSYVDPEVFKGFSITAPLKEEVLSLFHFQSKSVTIIGAANTLIWNKNYWHLKNTDKIGAIKALEEKTSLKKKSALILGSGGVAKALAAALNLRCKKLAIGGRDLEKTEDLARKFGAQPLSLIEARNQLSNFNLIVNATTVGIKEGESFIFEALEDAKKIIFETISCPRETAFVKLGVKGNHTVVFGERMFLHQAAYQWLYWLRLSPTKGLKILEKGYYCFLQKHKAGS